MVILTVITNVALGFFATYGVISIIHDIMDYYG